MRGDDRDALYLLLMVFYEAGVFFKSRDILPAVETGSIDQQSDFAMLIASRVAGNIFFMIMTPLRIRS